MSVMLAFGGRKYRNKARLFLVLDEEHEREPITLLIEGEAPGADKLSRKWAEARGVEVLPFPADWDDIDRPGAVVRKSRSGKLYDAAAGPFRNMKMLREGRPDRAVGFAGGSGTRDMRVQCLEYGLTPRMHP
jgi:hypothetical protein